MWDPEKDMPSVLPFSFLPKPKRGAHDVPLRKSTLSWIPGRNALQHNIYFGASEEPDFKGTQKHTVYEPGTLQPETTYYWRVDEVTEDEIVQGQVWSFRTQEVTGE
jgi:hypothetical protein